jgi:trimeric autotransporter adhesin
MSRVSKDVNLNYVSSDFFLLPRLDVSSGQKVYPTKGALAYDLLSDPIGSIWYGNGTQWLPVFSNSSFTGYPITNISPPPNAGIPIFNSSTQQWVVYPLSGDVSNDTSGGVTIESLQGNPLGPFTTLNIGDSLGWDGSKWTNIISGSGGVTSFSAGSTGLTPSVPTGGSVILGGVLNVSNGGTGVSNIPPGGLIYGNGNSPVGVSIGVPGQLLSSGGSFSPVWSGGITYNGSTITGIPDPVNIADAVNKSYVDAVAAGINVHSPVRLATTTPLTGLYNNGVSGVGATLTNNGPLAPLQIDTTPVSPGDRILVKNQAIPQQNGVYDVSVVGDGLTPWILTRSADFDNSPPGEVVPGDFVFVESGPTNASTSWVQTQVGTGPGGSIIIGVNPINFSQFSSAASYSAGTGLNLSGTVFSNTGVLSNNGGTTGLTFSPANGNSVMNGILSIANGGTGSSSGYIAGTGLTLTGTQFSIADQIVGATTAANLFPQLTYNSQGQLTAVTQLPFPIVLDSAATPTYPADLTKGVWYGLNTFANAFDATCVTMGQNANTDGIASVSIGRGAGGVVQSVAIGDGAISLGTAGVSIGRAASGTTQSVTIGDGAISAVGGISLGRATNGTTGSIAIGDGANSASGGVNSIAIGASSFVDVTGVLSLGPGAYSALSGISIGSGAQTRLGSIAIGNSAQSVNNGSGNSIAIGGGANTTSAPASVAIGQGANCTSGGSVSVGAGATSRLGAVAIGQGASAISTPNNGSVAIGNGAAANNQFCVAIGQGATSNVQQGVSVGTSSSSNINGASFGFSAVTGSGGVAVGSSALGSGSNSVAVGISSVANVTGGVAVGSAATTNGIAGSIALGASASPLAASHALAISVNNASVIPGTLGITINGAAKVLDAYTSLYNTTAGSGPTVLTSTSAKIQYFTTAQTVTLPDVTTLQLGFYFTISNTSVGNLIIQSSGGNTVITLTSGTWAEVCCILTTGTTAASWNVRPGGVATLGGDVTGPMSSNTVTRIRGNDVNPALPANGAVLAWTGTEWAPVSTNIFYGTNTATNRGGDCITFGNGADTTGGGNAVALGISSRSKAANSISIGTSSFTQSNNCIAIGTSSSSFGGLGSGIAIGVGATTSWVNTIAIGTGANAAGAGNNIAIGAGTIVGGTSAISIGQSAIGGGNNCIAIGRASAVGGLSAVGVGNATSSSATGSVAVGNSSSSSATGSVAVGDNAISNVVGGVSVGTLATTNGITNSIVLNATGAVLSPLSTSHALAIGVNSASVAPGVVGLTLNGAVSQIEQYSSRFTTTVSSATPVMLLPTSSQIQRFSGSTAQVVLLPLTSSLSNGFTYKIANEGTANITVGSTLQTTVSVANTLPVASINVASVAGFTPTGTIYVVSGSGVQTITYASLTPAVATITGATSGVLPTVFTAVNTFSVGQSVTITGVTPVAYNGTYIVSAATGANFSVAALITGPYVSGGIATPSPSFNGCTGGVGAMSVGGLVRQIIAPVLTVPPTVQADIEVVDITGTAGINGWFAPSSPPFVETPGAVTQLTSLTTGVTVNAAQGKITLFSTLPGSSKTRFTITNSRVRAASVINALSQSESAVNGFPQVVGILAVGAGTFDIIVYNSDTNATTAAPIIHFNILFPA